MAGVKVFISSTCYDLSILRAELRNFVLSLGHEPVMSEYADVLYDPRIHTHASCVNEVNNCDIMVVIIGSRFGGKSVPQAFDQIDLSLLHDASKKADFISEDKVFSITQLEVLKAIENNIPIYTFVEKKVYFEHEVYEKNKNKPEVINNIEFPGIDKRETAPYIFEFLNYIRLRKTGNQFFQFEKLQDIEDVLKKQWSAYFHQLLYEQRNRDEELKQIARLNEQFEDLKTAIITSIENVDQRAVANGIVRYRRLSEFLFGIKCEQNQISSFTGTFDEILKEQNIVDVIDFNDVFPVDNRRVIYPRTIYLLKDGTFYDSKLIKEVLFELKNEWDSFKKLTEKTKELILDALREIGRPSMLIRHHSEQFEDYLVRIRDREVHNSEM
ncbi:MAG: DUF4062 domain-containing protein [Lachnospiraceae bacterium]|nr:DUF4062 domain-containing protein [Lachnospiraceae bacterium]